MKIMHEQIDFPGRSAVKVKLPEIPYFTYPWHFHAEYELLYIIQGFGTRFVADSIQPFEAGELVFLGSNLPHFWKSDISFHQNEVPKSMKYVVIQFPNAFFKEAIGEYPEFRLIKELLERSMRGILFSKDFSEKAKGKLYDVIESKGFDRAIQMLELLQFLSSSNDYKLLAGELYQIENYNFMSDRLTKVMHYLNTSYLKKIELEKVAEVANLHPSAFCRYFKEKSGKSLSEFVNDMRVGYACRLILEGKMSVSQICYESGFNNLSNFNRIFKKHTGFNPTMYYQEFHKSEVIY